MATSSERTSPLLSEQLHATPYRFEFFQAVRMLQHLARSKQSDNETHPHAALGHEGPPRDEPIRFRALVSHSFPAGQISALHLPPASDGSTSQHPNNKVWTAEMVVAFLGLTGPVGALPQHYTQLMIDRVRRKDYTLRDFFDIFNHRTTSLFYRSWEKYRFPIGIEQSKLRQEPWEDLFTRCLYCLIGLGSGPQVHGEGAMRRRLEVRDDLFLYYSGFFAHRPRNAASLESLVQDYWKLPAKILQFQGQWLRLAPEDQTQIPKRDAWQPLGTQLGRDALVGERIWSAEHRFRIRLGPLTYRDFCRFTPLGHELVPLSQVVRMYVGPEFDFDVHPILLAAEVPCSRLGGEPANGSRLGWNTWLQSQPRKTNATDAVFQHEGNPIVRPHAPEPAQEYASQAG